MLHRSWSGVLLSAAVLAAIPLTGTARAEDAPATSAAPATPAAAAPAAAEAPAAAPVADRQLKIFAEDFLHYSLVNNIDLAKANGQALVNANPSPVDFLAAFEAAANGRNVREILIRNQKRDDLRDISVQLLDRLEEGYRAVLRDPIRIRAEIERLGNGPRAYANAKERLVAAGQFAGPLFIEYIQNESKKNLQPFIVRVMTEIGRPLLPPVLEQLKMSEQGDKILLINVVGQIGYPQALPTLQLLATDEKSPELVRAAAKQAVAAIDHSGSTTKSASDLFLGAAQSYYSNKPSYQPLLPGETTNPIWQYDKSLNNVAPINVPTPIWHDIMSMRNAEQVLKLQSTNSPAISLWIAANLRREIQLPQGATDPTKIAGAPDASFVARAAGPIYLNPVLTQALNDRDPALILKAIEVLEATGGTQGLVNTAQGAPLVRALSYPERAVRFKAAFALAGANPNKEFPSFFRVVPILGEAISGTGTPNALVVEPDENTRNKLAGTLRDSAAHYNVYAGGSLSSALEVGRRAPAFDVIVIAGGPEVSRIGQLAATDYRLAASTVLVSGSAASLPGIKLGLAEAKNYAPIDETADEAGLNAALAIARADAGNTPLDPEKANAFALTALKLLSGLAADHATIYKVEDALPTLIDALKDKRTDVAIGASVVLGQLNNAEAQRSLATIALSGDTDASLKPAFFTAVAESAKRTGDVLDSATINGLIKLLGSDADAATKLAAATALGALNVPSNQASTLILNQAK